MKRSYIHIYIITPSGFLIAISVPNVILCTMMMEIFFKTSTTRISKDVIA